MKLSQLIDTWNILHVTDTGDIGFGDLESALEKSGVVIENDCTDENTIRDRYSKRVGGDPCRGGVF